MLDPNLKIQILKDIEQCLFMDTAADKLSLKDSDVGNLFQDIITKYGRWREPVEVFEIVLQGLRACTGYIKGVESKVDLDKAYNTIEHEIKNNLKPDYFHLLTINGIALTNKDTIFASVKRISELMSLVEDCMQFFSNGTKELEKVEIFVRGKFKHITIDEYLQVYWMSTTYMSVNPDPKQIHGAIYTEPTNQQTFEVKLVLKFKES